MRAAALLIVLGACSSGEGTVLELTTGDATMQADHIDVVLAAAAPVTVQGQHTEYDTDAEHPAIYFRQRAVGGRFTNEDDPRALFPVDGFRVRLEANPTLVDETTLVPVVLVYDANDKLIGVGMQSSTDGVPRDVEIKSGHLAKYIVPVTTVAATGPDAAVTLDHARTVTCAGQVGDYTSGVAFRITMPGASPEVRVLLPDPGIVDADDRPVQDASDRDLDLDCDGRVAGPDDCDDLHDDVYTNRIPADVRDLKCDGVDHACRGHVPAVGICMSEPDGCGLELCDPDTGKVNTGPSAGVCFDNPLCACPGGSGQCHACRIHYEHPAGGTTDPCARSVSQQVGVPGCTDENPCRVRIDASPGWLASMSRTPSDAVIVQELMNVGHEGVAIHLDVAGGPIDPTDTSLGQIYLRVVHTNAGIEGFALDIEYDQQGCGPLPVSTMQCDL